MMCKHYEKAEKCFCVLGEWKITPWKVHLYLPEMGTFQLKNGKALIIL